MAKLTKEQCEETLRDCTELAARSYTLTMVSVEIGLSGSAINNRLKMFGLTYSKLLRKATLSDADIYERVKQMRWEGTSLSGIRSALKIGAERVHEVLDTYGTSFEGLPYDSLKRNPKAPRKVPTPIESLRGWARGYTAEGKYSEQFLAEAENIFDELQQGEMR